MVSAPPKPKNREHNDATCLCRDCRHTRLKLRQLGHFAPEPGDYVAPHPHLEAEIRELF